MVMLLRRQRPRYAQKVWVSQCMQCQDTSPRREIDGPAHARAVRGVEGMGSEDNKHEEEGRMRVDLSPKLAQYF